MDEAFAASIDAIDWFGSCEEVWGGELPIPSSAVPTLLDAGNACADPAWEELTDAAAGRLGDHVAAHCPVEYRNWNPLVRAVKERLTIPLAESVWRPFAEWYGFDQRFVLGVQWNVLHAVLEYEYRGCAGRPEFFLHLLDVYRAGHIPCGWAGEWPAGCLLVW